MCRVCECYRGGIVVMDVIWRRAWVICFEEGCFICSELGKGVPTEAGKYIFRAANVWWRCADYFIIASCS